MICTKCKVEKDNSSFRIRLNSKSGFQYWCRDCENQGNKKRYIAKPKRVVIPKQKDQIKLDAFKRMLKSRYKITHQEYTEMYDLQNHSCKICKKLKSLGGRKGLQVDHCHKTGKVRALLCPNCNTLLGSCNDNIDRLKSCILYLKQHLKNELSAIIGQIPKLI
jgi:hypothetical protein